MTIHPDEVNWGFVRYAEFTAETAFYPHFAERDYFEINYLILGLGGEAGEAVDVWKKLSRAMNPEQMMIDDNFMQSGVWREYAEDLLYEIGDVVWYVSHLLRVMDIRLEELTMLNTYKLWVRHQNAPWPFDEPEHDIIARINNVIDRVKGHIDATHRN